MLMVLIGEASLVRIEKLLLLQLASNLLTGRTDQPGFKGFLDVLGQAGQNVIPMALALEDERRKDETELKKAIIANNNKKNLLEYSPDNKIVKVKLPGKTEFKTFRARTSKNGNVEIKIPNAAEDQDAYVDVTNYEYKMLDAPESKDIERINKGISVKARALRGLNNALKLTMKQPYSSVSKPFINVFFKHCNFILSLMCLDVFINFF